MDFSAGERNSVQPFPIEVQRQRKFCCINRPWPKEQFGACYLYGTPALALSLYLHTSGPSTHRKWMNKQGKNDLW